MQDVEQALTDYYEIMELTDVAVAPGGDRVAFVADEFDAVENERVSSLFVVPSDGSEPPHRLTRASSASDPRWGPEGNSLAFLAERERDDGLRTDRTDANSDEDEIMEPDRQVWVFDLARGGDARQVTTREEGIRQFDWGPDGDRIVAAARDPTEEQRARLAAREDGGPIEIDRLQHKYDGEGWLDDVTTYLFVVDVVSREATRLDEAYGGGALEPQTGLAPAWSPAGDRIAFLSNRTERPDDSTAMDVYTVASDGTDLRKLTDGDLSAGGGTWGPNGRYYAFSASDADDAYDPEQVFVADTDEGGVTSLSASLDRPLGRGGHFEWVGERTLLGLVGDEGRTRLARFSVGERAAERVYESQGEFQNVSLLDVGAETVAIGRSEPHDGPDAYALALESLDGEGNAEPTRLTELNNELLAAYDAPETRWISFDSEGATIEALVYLPPGYDPDAGSAPLIATIHGGPVSYDSPAFDFDYTFWTNRDYVLLRVNYRGSSSYGQSFSRAIEGDWGHREPTDVMKGIESVLDRGWVDPERVFVTGFSYGGAQTAYILSQSDLAAAGAAEHGVYDRHSYFGTGDSHNRMERDFGLPWENLDTYERISSITDVGAVEAPLLITAGGADWRCPPSQSEQLYVSVRKQGVPARLVVYPNEHHDVGEPDRAVHRLTELTEWFEEHDPAR